MAKTREQKKKMLDSYKELVKNSESIFFIEPKSLPANNIIQLRKKLNAVGAYFHFIKNRVFAKAVEGNKKFPGLKEGRHAAIFIKTDSIQAAKLLNEFTSEMKDEVVIKHGVFNNEVISSEQIIELASLPSHEALLTKFVIALNSPMQNLASVLSANLRDFVSILNQVSKKNPK